MHNLTLYFGNGSCSQCCRIALEVANANYKAVLVNFDNQNDVTEVEQLNPMGALPILKVGDKVLTQNIAILEFIADNHPDSRLLPKTGSVERAETMKWLSFVASDLHKAFSPLFGLQSISENSDTRNEIAKWAKAEVNAALTIVNKQLATQPYIAGREFSVADAYLFIVAGWGQWVNVSIQPFTHLVQYLERLKAIPAVQRALNVQGL